MSELKSQLNDIKRAWRWALALGVTATTIQAATVLSAASSGEQLLRGTDPATALWFATVVTAATALTIALAHASRRILDRAALWIDHTIPRTILAEKMAASASTSDLSDPDSHIDALRNAFSNSSITTAARAFSAPAFILVLLPIDFRAAAVASIIYAVGIGIVLGGMSNRKPTRDLDSHRARAILSAEPRHLAMLRAAGLDTAARSAWLTHKIKASAGTYAMLRTNGRWTLTANLFAAVSLLGATLLTMAALHEGLINRFEAVTSVFIIAWITYTLRGAIFAAPGLGTARTAWRNLVSRALHGSRPAQPAPHGIIRVENVSVVAPVRRQAILTGITLACQPGETVVVSGAPGAGKSVLAALIAGAIAPTDGRYFNGNLRIGYVPEMPIVVEGTVAQNIARFTRYDLNAVVAAIERAGVQGILDERDVSLEMPLHCSPLQPLGSLSFREARAINIARAVFAPIDVLVIDKPELAMEPADVHAIVAALWQLRASGVGLVIASNDTRFHALADRLAHLDNGRVVQSPIARLRYTPPSAAAHGARGQRFAMAR